LKGSIVRNREMKQKKKDVVETLRANNKRKKRARKKRGFNKPREGKDGGDLLERGLPKTDVRNNYRDGRKFRQTPGPKILRYTQKEGRVPREKGVRMYRATYKLSKGERAAEGGRVRG